MDHNGRRSGRGCRTRPRRSVRFARVPDRGHRRPPTCCHSGRLWRRRRVNAITDRARSWNGRPPFREHRIQGSGTRGRPFPLPDLVALRWAGKPADAVPAAGRIAVEETGRAVARSSVGWAGRTDAGRGPERHARALRLRKDAPGRRGVAAFVGPPFRPPPPGVRARLITPARACYGDRHESSRKGCERSKRANHVAKSEMGRGVDDSGRDRARMFEG
jgi:hypothetical protein